MEIEVFKTGKVIDSAGQEHDFSNADLEEIAKIYNEQISLDRSNIAPLVKGHPQTSDPALGWTKYLKVKDEKLIAGISELDADFKKELSDGRYKKVSISLGENKMLRHIGFLGAATPAVKGLSTASFAENENVYSIEFAEHNKKNLNEADALRMQLRKALDKIGELEACRRKNEFREYCSRESSKIKNQKLRSRIENNFPELLEMAYKADEAGGGKSNSVLVRNIITEFSSSEMLQNLPNEMLYNNNEFEDKFKDKICDEERRNMHFKAMKILRQYPKIRYEDAINMV